MKQYIFLFILLLFYLFPFFSLKSQNITIYDRETQQPVSNVVIFDEAEQISISTNNNGIADLSIFPKETNLWLKHPAYNLLLISTKNRNQDQFYLVPKIFTLDEFVVSANRVEENKKNIPYFLQTVAPKTIQYNNANTAADILTSTGYVSIQKSQGGGGSPNLRGFEANRILLVLDGVRMNNAIYRSGHLQNSITIDPNILANTEILFGPSSVMYGSDALGGVISYITKNPVFSTNNKTLINSGAFVQNQTAINTQKTNLHLNIGGKKIASFSSFSYSDYGNIIMGKNRRKDIFPYNWGKMYHYSKRINGVDYMIPNKNPNKQLFTRYHQYDFIQKLSFQLNPNHQIIVNGQYSTSSDISRFDQLNDYKHDILKFSEYYYGPQERLFLAANSYYNKQTHFYNSIHTTIAYQNTEESRHSRKFNSNEKLNQTEKVDAFSINIDFTKKIGSEDRLTYGLEYLYNYVNSTAYYNNLQSNTKESAPTRYPNGGTDVHTYAIYLSYQSRINSLLQLNGGLRLGHYHYNSKFEADKYFEPIINQLDNKNTAPSGSFGLILTPTKQWKINGILTTGYRVPNVDDYGKIRAKNDDISLPNPNLKPEFAYNIELSVSKTFFDELGLINISLYKTWLKDAIIRSYNTPYSQETLLYDGDIYTIVTNTNAQKASIKGFSAGINISPFTNTSIYATINYTKGEVTSIKEPLGHITPVFGKISGSYNTKNYKTELYLYYQGKKALKDMSPYGEDNEDEGTENGFPSWTTINWANQLKISENIQFQFSVENIFDLHYKNFASGISAPGRNFIFSIVGKF